MLQISVSLTALLLLADKLVGNFATNCAHSEKGQRGGGVPVTRFFSEEFVPFLRHRKGVLASFLDFELANAVRGAWTRLERVIILSFDFAYLNSCKILLDVCKIHPE